MFSWVFFPNQNPKRDAIIVEDHDTTSLLKKIHTTKTNLLMKVKTNLLGGDG